MTIYLVRHARAGNRSRWPYVDEIRPLSARGHLQANHLVDLLADAEFEHLLSSPHVRCMETLVPLAAARRMALEPVEALAEGGALLDALTLVRKYAATGAVMSTHGDVLGAVLEHYARRGIDLGRRPQCPKGCTWVLETDASGEVVGARYIPPPAVPGAE
jgi:broad specificity phosphatase PhoE